jgi:hypothetical protein
LKSLQQGGSEFTNFINNSLQSKKDPKVIAMDLVKKIVQVAKDVKNNPAENISWITNTTSKIITVGKYILQNNFGSFK